MAWVSLASREVQAPLVVVPVNQASTRMRLMAMAVRVCCRKVLGLPWCCRGPGLDEPSDPIAQTLVELFADVKRRLLETVTVQAPRERLGRDPADHDDPRPGDRAGPDSSGPSR
jgi:hypothetical protein